MKGIADEIGLGRIMLGIFNAILWVMLAIITFFIIKLNLYVFFENNTNHTGMPIQNWGHFCVGLAIAAAVASRIFKPSRTRKLMVAFAALAFFAATNLLTFHHLHIMMNHGDWGNSGMPGRPAWSLVRCWHDAKNARCQPDTF
ncbi:MAG: hypothetical protein P8Y67_11785 [Alphaproteobacteria bacterium]